MKIQTKSEKGMGERGWGKKREGGLAKRGRGPAPAMCFGPRNMGIRSWIGETDKYTQAHVHTQTETESDTDTHTQRQTKAQ